jgi:hypothetical protein
MPSDMLDPSQRQPTQHKQQQPQLPPPQTVIVGAGWEVSRQNEGIGPGEPVFGQRSTGGGGGGARGWHSHSSRAGGQRGEQKVLGLKGMLGFL